MQKVLLLLIVFVMQSIPTFAQQQLIINSNVEITVPTSFKIADKKNTADSTLITDENGKAILSYRLGSDSITDNEIPAFTDDRLKLAQLHNESFKYIDDGIHLQDGKNIGYIKFSTIKEKTKYFHYSFFISVDAKALLFKFSCPFKQRKRWEAAINNMASSLRIIQ